jgi:hypothetical protein
MGILYARCLKRAQENPRSEVFFARMKHTIDKDFTLD